MLDKEDLIKIRDLLLGNLIFLKKESFIVRPTEEIAKIEEKIRETKHYINVLESLIRSGHESNKV